ncbi:MAG: YlxR family protein [Firmicutes bacterium]|nr:YlxR family protein [Bacillota bacterium]
MRTCIGCREVQPKRDLVRVVRTPQGDVVLDTTGKKSGRGAYLCREPGCLEAAIRSKAFQRALECQVSQSVIEDFREFLLGHQDKG